MRSVKYVAAYCALAVASTLLKPPAAAAEPHPSPVVTPLTGQAAHQPTTNIEPAAVDGRRHGIRDPRDRTLERPLEARYTVAFDERLGAHLGSGSSELLSDAAVAAINDLSGATLPPGTQALRYLDNGAIHALDSSGQSVAFISQPYLRIALQ